MTRAPACERSYGVVPITGREQSTLVARKKWGGRTLSCARLLEQHRCAPGEWSVTGGDGRPRRRDPRLLGGDSRPSRVCPPKRMSGPDPSTEPNAEQRAVCLL